MKKTVVWLLLTFALPTYSQDTDDVNDVASQEFRTGANENQRYLLIGPAGKAKPPKAGYRLLLILPGGDGSAEFHPFCKRIYQHAVPPGYVAAQLVAPKWTQNQQIVWPTAKSRVTGQKFTTEQFIAAVVEDVKKRHAIDPQRVFTLTWSSSGPAAYTASVAPKTPITGSFVAMSVFRPELLGNVSLAKGRRYYIYHSPQDRVCPFRMAQTARDVLTRSGAAVQFATYEGGHGWTSQTVFPDIRKGLLWLQDTATSKPAAKEQ